MSAYDENNIFAKILRAEIPCDKVFEDDHVLAFRDINPVAPTHILVIPKGAYVSMDDFSANASAEEQAAFIAAIGHVAREDGVAQGGYRVLANIGENGRQEVPHLHMHVIGGRDVGPMIQRPKTD
ncbi:MAG: histidine triad nucleotide-binding protein [Alphaproteobacteria bacterium]|nr:histidine triad nucleotide-binding protein [Alphaproteobacteria bacterium SS10]